MYSFTYHRPSTVRQAINLLSKVEDPKLLAGGQTLLERLFGMGNYLAKLEQILRIEPLVNRLIEFLFSGIFGASGSRRGEPDQ